MPIDKVRAVGNWHRLLIPVRKMFTAALKHCPHKSGKRG